MKISLHIGINQYDPAYYGEASLQQCVKDAETMYGFAESLGFKPFLVRDQDATVESFKDFLVKSSEQLTSGDTLMITQSSHGTYWDTPKGRATGLCMHDQILWDFQLLPYWKKFRPGVKIIRVTDACFSESNFKMPVGAAGLKFDHDDKRRRLYEIDRSNAKKVKGVKPTSGSTTGIKCSMLNFASSSIEEPSYENQDGGVFTSALVLSYGEYRKLYASVFKQACAVITGWGYPQHPVMEKVKWSSPELLNQFGN